MWLVAYLLFVLFCPADALSSFPANAAHPEGEVRALFLRYHMIAKLHFL